MDTEQTTHTLSLILTCFTPQMIFILISAIVAILILLEGRMLRKTGGKLPKSSLFYVSSIIDTVWFVACVIAVYVIDFEPIALVIPTVYGLYTVIGWIYGTYLLKGEGMSRDPKKLVIPLRYVSYSQSFALVFLVLCLWVMLSPFVTASS